MPRLGLMLLVVKSQCRACGFYTALCLDVETQHSGCHHLTRQGRFHSHVSWPLNTETQSETQLLRALRLLCTPQDAFAGTCHGHKHKYKTS
jgi:hypothetical protein